MKKLFLYTTIACHLCEQAEALLNQTKFPENLKLEKRDIIDNQQWLEKYRTSIPVLAFNGKELFWPFNKNQIEHLIR